MKNKLVVVLGVVVSTLGCRSEPPKASRVQVMNVNIHYGRTLVALLTDGQTHPWSTTICGEHPELWQGEHARIVLRQGQQEHCVELEDVELL